MDGGPDQHEAPEQLQKKVPSRILEMYVLMGIALILDAIFGVAQARPAHHFVSVLGDIVPIGICITAMGFCIRGLEESTTGSKFHRAIILVLATAFVAAVLLEKVHMGRYHHMIWF